MATVTHLVAATEERYRINLGGTRAIFEHCHGYG
jgi:UDP-glucose 4-epimerase